jgi:prepilin-type N-terminal cleavage/methylation domain-containing protein
MKRSTTGFTLIELLIVVAIIAILAAIAVPNFLEAQTRAKVSRVYTDFRSLATALESYRTDHSDYLPDVTNGGGWIGGFNPGDRLIGLTTPVAYLTKAIVQSPFISPYDEDVYWSSYQYTTTKGQLRAPSGNAERDAYLNGFYRMANGQPPKVGQGLPPYADGPAWMMLDRGPDLLYFYIWVNPGWIGASVTPQTYAQATVFYDPTNGSISEGEICSSQTKGSNKN